MSDLPTREELVEAAARAIAPIAWAALGTGDTLAQLNRRKASLRHAEMALDAVLPLVMRGPVEALGPPACKCGGVDAFDHSHACVRELRDWHETRDSRARTVRQWAEMIGGG